MNIYIYVIYTNLRVWLKRFREILIIISNINPLVPEFCFPLIFETFNLRVAPIAYRLIGATLIGNCFDDSFLFKINFFAIHTEYSGSVTNGLIYASQYSYYAFRADITCEQTTPVIIMYWNLLTKLSLLL